MRDGWREVFVEDVATVVGGGTPKSSVPEYWGGNIPWLTPKDLAQNPARYTAGGARSITESGLKNSSAKVLPVGSVLLTSRAPVGYVSVASEPIATNQGFKSLILDDTQLPGFWYYLLGHSTHYLQANSGGSTFQEISGAAVKKLRFIVPPLDEQQRIVDLVGSLDDAIEAAALVREKGADLAREMRAAAFQSALDKGLTARAGDVFDMLLGRQKSAAQSIGDHVIPYLRAANIRDGAFDLSDLKRMNFDPSEQAKYGVRKGDVMLVEGGSIGLSAMWEDSLPGTVGFDKHVIRLRARDDFSIPEFALQWTKWAHESGKFAEQATGVTIKALGFGRASAMPVPALPVEEQGEFTASLEAADAVVAKAGDSQYRLRDLRSNLLTALLSREHEIPESYDELMEEVAA